MEAAFSFLAPLSGCWVVVTAAWFQWSPLRYDHRLPHWQAFGLLFGLVPLLCAKGAKHAYPAYAAGSLDDVVLALERKLPVAHGPAVLPALTCGAQVPHAPKATLSSPS